MARPKKEGMDYFSHDTDAVNDEKIEAMRTLFGNDGYAFYFILLERIYRSERGELDISNFTVKTVLISKLGIKAEQFEPMLEAAFEIGLFDRGMYSERSCLSSLGIQKRWNEIDLQRQKWRKKKGESTGNSNIKEDNTNNPDGKPELSPEKGTQSKVKESKVNKKESNKELYTSDFESFWNHYPRKIGKQETAKVFQRLIKNKESPQVIIQCASNYKTHCEIQQTLERYIKHPKTFLNEERYKDYTNGGVEVEKLTEHTQGLRHRGDQAKSEYDFLDSNNRT